MDEIKIIGITGKAGVGKSTYAERLADDINGTVIEITHPIKDEAYKRGWNGKKDNAGRSLLQQIGREGREFEESIWISNLVFRMFQHYNLVKKDYPKKKIHRYIVPDIRVLNEVNFLDNLNYYKGGVVEFSLHYVERDFKTRLSKEQQEDYTEREVERLKQFADKVVKVE